MTTYETAFYGEKYLIRANFDQASSSVERGTIADSTAGYDVEDWESTGLQVSDFCHSPKEAMRAELEQAITASGDDAADFFRKIENALGAITSYRDNRYDFVRA